MTEVAKEISGNPSGIVDLHFNQDPVFLEEINRMSDEDLISRIKLFDNNIRAMRSEMIMYEDEISS